MNGQDSLESLRGLHQDLIALSESRLPNVERLWADLEAHIEEFKKLLDKTTKSDASRSSVLSGTSNPNSTNFYPAINNNVCFANQGQSNSTGPNILPMMSSRKRR